MNLIERLSFIEEALKKKENMGEALPEIRYFDGTERFSTSDGEYSAKSLEESLNLFVKKVLK
tara:strand:+ start:311 stop:496 length:186 start_codon:yes stop_codon:yes gene_type:complete